MRPPLHVVLPAGVDDPAAPSGGNRYDREVLNRLPAAFAEITGAGPRPIAESTVPGAWPSPAPADRDHLARVLAGCPDGATVLLDGLVAGGVPEVLEPHAARLRLVILVHLPLSDETGLSPERAAGLRAMERRAVHLAAGVIATSSQAAAHVAAMHDRTGVHVAAPGVDLAEPAEPSPAGHRLLCVASLTHRKGQDLLIQALAQLGDLAWECTFVGAGTIPDHPEDGRIRFAGPLAGAELEAAYAGADLFVLPSRAETYGMVITEALAHGLPVVATAVGGVPEALGEVRDEMHGEAGSAVGEADWSHGETRSGGPRAAAGRERPAVPGSLVPPDDPDRLAAVLRTWLTDPDLRARWRARARARRATLTGWDDTARRLAVILDDIEKGTT